MPNKWTDLRSYKNSQYSAFEELCCQLAEYEAHPQGAKFLRKGTPDAGVECLWILPTGAEWGWQAKFLSPPFGNAQWRQLDKSVLDAIDNHPRLTRYTICLPFDRPDPRSKKDKKSFLNLWNARVEKWSAYVKQKKRSVEFIYWGDHEIFERLAKQEHAGRQKYWFDEEFLSRTWFENQLREVTANAGDRYTPDLNVELPISFLFESLGRTQQAFGRIHEIHKEIRKSFKHLSIVHLKEINLTQTDELQKTMNSLFEFLSDVGKSLWEPLQLSGVGLAQVKAAQELISSVRQRMDQAPESQQAKAQTVKNEYYDLQRFLGTLQKLRDFAESPAATVFDRPALLIVGDAGSGKTHLLCDVAQRRTRSGLPTITILGEQIGNSEPWNQIIKLLNLDCSRETLLGALDAAASASGGRALIQIDALNEGEGQKVWPKYLSGMLAQLESYPRIGIVVTVRKPYELITIPEQVVAKGNAVRIEHEGFKEHAYEAANRFLAYFGIEPSVPLLFPEFGNPQFLLLFCKGLNNKNLSRIPLGSMELPPSLISISIPLTISCLVRRISTSTVRTTWFRRQQIR